MVFYGISKDFLLTDAQQYETIGLFWDEMAALYGLENLRGLGYRWQDNKISYAIGLKNGCIENHNLSITLPDNGWTQVLGKTNSLKELYDDIYKDGALQFEIETFYNSGKCEISYYRSI